MVPRAGGRGGSVGTRSAASSDDGDDISLTLTEHSRGSRGTHRSSRTTGTAVVNRSAVNRPQYIDPKVAEKEQRFVSISKWGMIVCLLLVAAAFCTATYLILVQQEQNEFEVQVSFKIAWGTQTFVVCICCLAVADNAVVLSCIFLAKLVV